jgi:hypothetical protein
MRFTIPFDEFLEDDSLSRHVYPEREGFGSEDDSKESALEERLGYFLEEWQHPGMMGGYASFQTQPPLLKIKGVEIFRWQMIRSNRDDACNLVLLTLGGQIDTVSKQAIDRGITPGARENEEDRR